jgi:hypothetical protein
MNKSMPRKETELLNLNNYNLSPPKKLSLTIIINHNPRMRKKLKDNQRRQHNQNPSRHRKQYRSKHSPNTRKCRNR